MQGKKKRHMRIIAGVIYLALGTFFLLFSLKIIKFIEALNILIYVFSKSSIQWCIGWTCIGIGAGLINTRNHLYENWYLHHIGYYGFVLVAVSLLSLVIAVYNSGVDLVTPNIKFYSLSALIGLIGGFLGDIFRPLTINLLNMTKKKDTDSKAK